MTVGFVSAAVATAAVFALVTGGGQDRMHAALAPPGCTPTLVLDGRRYVERVVDAGRMKPGRALEDGLLRPCGPAPTEVTATAVAGVDARRAVAVRGARRGLIYVASPCGRAPAARLLSCLLAPR